MVVYLEEGNVYGPVLKIKPNCFFFKGPFLVTGGLLGPCVRYIQCKSLSYKYCKQGNNRIKFARIVNLLSRAFNKIIMLI